MVQLLDNYFGIHESALHMQSRRARILASNLANADTPGYKARDIDFKDALQRATGNQDSGSQLKVTQPGHIGNSEAFAGADILYRQPNQASLDGNTVEPNTEMAAYTENSIRYMTSLRIVSGKISTMLTALRGQ